MNSTQVRKLVEGDEVKIDGNKKVIITGKQLTRKYAFFKFGDSNTWSVFRIQPGYVKNEMKNWQKIGHVSETEALA